MMKDVFIQGENLPISLCPTGTTTLLDAGVPEALIQKCSGHCSTKALRMYERVIPNQDLKLAISQILHSLLKLIYKPVSRPTTYTFSEADFDLDASFSAKRL
jgi:hypothetical protein